MIPSPNAANVNNADLIWNDEDHLPADDFEDPTACFEDLLDASDDLFDFEIERLMQPADDVLDDSEEVAFHRMIRSYHGC